MWLTQPKPWCSCWCQSVGHSQSLDVLAGVGHSPSLGVLAGVGHSPSLDVLAGVRHSPGLGVPAGVSVLDTAQALMFLLVLMCWTQPKHWCSYWCQCVGDSPSLGVLAGVGHSLSIGVLAGVNVLDIAQALVFLLMLMC